MLDHFYISNGLIKCRCQLLVNYQRVIAFYIIWLVAKAFKHSLKVLLFDTGKNCRVGNFVTIEVQNRQNGTITRRIDKFIALPCGCQRAGFCFAITDNTQGQQIRIVKDSAKGMSKRIPQFTTFMDGAGGFRRAMAGHAAGKGKLSEQFLHACPVLRNIGVKFAIAAFHPGIGEQCRGTVPGTGYENGIEVFVFDHPVHVGINQIETRGCTPVPKTARLDMLFFQRLFQQWIVH